MRGALVFSALVGATLLGSTFAGGGSGPDGVLPVGGAAVLLLAASLVAVGAGRIPPLRLGRSGVALLAATLVLVAWTGASVGWSIVPDRSWESFDKSVACAAFLGLGLVLAALGAGRSARLAGAMLAVVVATTVVGALVAKVFPGLDPGGDRVARLREPVGYWNALALLADVGVVLGLWLAAGAGHRRGVRVAGALLVYASVLSVLLTLSRAGIVVGAGGVALWLLLARGVRVEAGLLLAASALPAALVAGWAFTRPALTEDEALRSDRVTDGRLFGLLAVLGVGVVLLLVQLVTRRSLAARPRRRVGTVLAVVATVCVVGLAAAAAASAADAVSAGRSCDEVVNSAGRLRSLDPNNRLCWWSEALHVFRGHAPLGAGSGSFEIARKRYRHDARNVLEPHSVPLQMLADGGLVGLGLFLALVGAGVAACVCALRRLDGPERVAATALVVVPAVYLGHALVDYDWNFLAVTAPTATALGVLAGAGRPAGSARPRPLLVVGAVALSVVVLVSFAFPRLADRLERTSTIALAQGDLVRAHDRARQARRLDPLSPQPLFALARVAEREGRRAAAERTYIRAVELQPDNPDTWYTLGIYEYEVMRNLCAAYRFLNNAYTLDPSGSQWRPGGPLDVARDAVNAGRCAPGS